MANILGKTLYSSPRRWPGRHAHGQEHKSSFSAPCAGLMGPPNIDQYTKDEPFAKQRALLGVSPAVTQAFLEDTKKTTLWPNMIFPRGIS